MNNPYRMKKNKIRFNLAKGENYMKWKINHSDGRVSYLNPTEVQLILTKCQLKNNKRSAQMIFDGGNKVVCAWILCEKVEIRYSGFNQIDLSGKRLFYNPRKKPYWSLHGQDIDMDTTFHDKIESVDYGLYLEN